MEKTVEALKRKGHMLRTWGGDTSVDGTMKEWQKIHELMLSQQKMFEHQVQQYCIFRKKILENHFH